MVVNSGICGTGNFEPDTMIALKKLIEAKSD